MRQNDRCLYNGAHFPDSFEGQAIRLSDTITVTLVSVTMKWGQGDLNLSFAIGL